MPTPNLFTETTTYEAIFYDVVGTPMIRLRYIPGRAGVELKLYDIKDIVGESTLADLSLWLSRVTRAQLLNKGLNVE